MASIYANLGLSMITVSTLLSTSLSPSVIEDLKTLKPPPDFNNTIATNCLDNPSLRYCDEASPMDFDEIFKFTIIASHLCNESNNPHCVDSFPKIDLRDRPIIAPLYLSFNFFWKYCPLTILSVDLSNCSLKGIFPTDVLRCTQIESLDLSRNELSGDFPVESFSSLKNLTGLNVSYNRFFESEAEFFKGFDSSSFLHSGLTPDRKTLEIKLFLFVFVFPILVVTIVGFLGWVCFLRPDFLPRALRREYFFTAPMLKAATDGFSKGNLVGKIDSVDIYRGTLRDFTEVRIEIYRDNISREARRRFVEECEVLVRLCHKNIARVIGWCDNRSFRAVVSELTEGQNIETWLLGSNPTWRHRLRIMKGVVLGMCYLHENWPDIGYDLGSSSVLLSENLEPLISRFKIEDHNDSTRRIYKLGILILEIIANKRPREEFEGGEGEEAFVEFVRTHYIEDTRKVMDEKMKSIEIVVIDQAKEVIGLGLMCTDETSNRQLNLRHVFRILSNAYDSVAIPTSRHIKSPYGDRSKENKRIELR